MRGCQEIVLVLVGALLMGTALADSDSNEQPGDSALEHWKSTNHTPQARDPQISSDGTTRFVVVPVNGTIAVLQEVKKDRRLLQARPRKLQADDNEDEPWLDEVPWPPNGYSLPKTGTAIHFREDTTMTDVSCFVFNHVDADDSFKVCDGNGLDLTVENGVTDIQLTGFQLGEYEWYVEDSFGDKSTPQTFTIVEPGDVVRRKADKKKKKKEKDPNVVEESRWPYGGQILGAAGRIYFTSNGEDYACSGTVMNDRESGRTLIVTAAHCVFDDIDWVFGSNVIFIPNRDSIQTTLTGEQIDRACNEDVCGCWSLSAGLVLEEWRDTDWPARLEYDYGIWVVDDVGSHDGTLCGSEALDESVEEFDLKLGVDLKSQLMNALGYSLEHNPDFRYCADKVETNQPVKGTDTYWLPNCGLTGGASGGPWIAGMDKTTGSGTIVSVNSWSYADLPGLGGPIIDESAGRCLVNAARKIDFKEIRAKPEGEQGVFVNCYNRPCVSPEEYESRRLRGTLDGRVLCEHAVHSTNEDQN